jgi:hypothetical protein
MQFVNVSVFQVAAARRREAAGAANGMPLVPGSDSARPTAEQPVRHHEYFHYDTPPVNFMDYYIK